MQKASTVDMARPENRSKTTKRSKTKFAPLSSLPRPDCTCVSAAVVHSGLPIVQTISLSFTNMSILKGTNEFIGLQNYADMFSDYGVQGALELHDYLRAGYDCS